MNGHKQLGRFNSLEDYEIKFPLRKVGCTFQRAPKEYNVTYKIIPSQKLQSILRFHFPSQQDENPLNNLHGCCLCVDIIVVLCQENSFNKVRGSLLEEKSFLVRFWALNERHKRTSAFNIS